MCAICGSARHDISECVEWMPHEEDFDNFGIDIDSQVMETAEHDGKSPVNEAVEENEHQEEEGNETYGGICMTKMVMKDIDNA